MFKKLIGKWVKIVYQDGSMISVVEGKVGDYDSDTKIILIEDDRSEKTVYVNTSHAYKLEVRNY